jgi:hypothetical protein
MAGASCGKIAPMGKTGETIKAVAVAAVVVAAVNDPFDDCRSVDGAACPSLAPEQRHFHERQPEVATPEPAASAGGGTVSLMLPTSITLTVTEG